MSPYKNIQHRADLKIQARGKTKEEMFSEALRGMFGSVGPDFEPNTKVEREIKIKSNNFGNLLVEFLNEALYLSDVNNEAYIVADFKKLTETELEATIFGQKVKGFNEEIKAVTHHGLKIEESDEGWSATILFDI